MDNLTLEQVTQSKSKMQKVEVHCKFNCITVNFHGAQHSIYVTDETVTSLLRIVSH